MSYFLSLWYWIELGHEANIFGVLLGKHRDLQRVTVPYAKLLGVVDEEMESGDMMET